MSKKIIGLLIGSLLLVTGNALSKTLEYEPSTLVGKKVLRIHGLESFLDTDSTQKYKDRFDNKEGPYGYNDTQPLSERSGSDKYVTVGMTFHSGLRLHENAELLQYQLKQIVENETCIDGCLFWTESTGDLISKYIMDNLDNWEIDRTKFKIIGSIDLVGASGGTEVAQLAVGALNVSSTILKFTGIKFVLDKILNALGLNKFEETFAGIGVDLQPHTARRHGKQNPIPRFRVVASGARTEFNKTFPGLGELIKIVDPFVAGADDILIPLHSACGAERRGNYYACYKNGYRHDGRKKKVTAPSRLQPNHYAIIGAAELSHGLGGGTVPTGKLIPINYKTGQESSAFGFDHKVKKKTTGRWFWKKKYIYIDKDKNQNMIDFIGQTFRKK